MSDAQIAPQPGAKEIDARAAKWLERENEEDWNQTDQAALDAWLSQDLSHRVAYWRLKAAWGRADRLAALRSTGEKPQPRARTYPLLLKIAAVVVLVAAAGALTFHYAARPQDRLYSTPIGGHETVRFADGTEVELNTNTQIRARMTTDQRIVWLEKGEAYFQVKHDALHPLIVMAGAHRVTDLGTKFLMRRDPKRLEVAVLEGRVWFDAPDAKASKPSLPLTRGEVAVASGKSFSLEHRTIRTLDNELGWRRGKLVFKDTTLADAAAEFNRYNREKLVIPNPAIGYIKIGGIFDATNIAAFTEVVEDVLGLTVHKHGKNIVISR